MAKIIFDAETGTVLTLHGDILIIDVDELTADFNPRLDPDDEYDVGYRDEAVLALEDNIPKAVDAALAVGAILENILAIAGQND